MVLTAPAKVNLYLSVIRRMDDGYHEIETLFERISIIDRISVEPAAENTSITCDDPRVPTGADSLLGRTVSMFNDACGKSSHFRIHLEKNIPIGAGLGGGSSDAASLLKGLNGLAEFPLGPEELLRISRSLGSDVPFFLEDCSFAHGSGRGDVINKIETPLNLWHVLVNPAFEVSSKEVYGKVSAFGLTKDRGVDRMMTAFLGGNKADDLSENLRNDLQAIVLQDFPVLEQVFCEMKNAGAQGVLLSGSGPTVFGIFAEDMATKAAEKIRRAFSEKKDWKVSLARTC